MTIHHVPLAFYFVYLTFQHMRFASSSFTPVTPAFHPEESWVVMLSSFSSFSCSRSFFPPRSPNELGESHCKSPCDPETLQFLMSFRSTSGTLLANVCERSLCVTFSLLCQKATDALMYMVDSCFCFFKQI